MSASSLTRVLLLCIVVCCSRVDSHDDHAHHHHHHEHEHHHHTLLESQQHAEDDVEQCSDAERAQQVSSSTDWSELFIPSSKREAFWHGILSTTFIGMAPILCVKFVSTKDYYLKILLSFAAGGLLGDVFLHLLPTALTIYNQATPPHHHHEHQHEHEEQAHAHSHNEGHSKLGMHILIGFVIFFVLEKLFHEFGQHSHSHSHSHAKTNGDGEDEQDAHDAEARARKNAVTILSICADASHNFTDGLTIAASFLFSFRMGLIQTFSILLHEIPHEIGDYAILIENGVSLRSAMFIQFLTALTCIVGTVIGFLLDGNQQIGTQWIIPFTAGGFIYISCVQVLPTLVERKYGKMHSALHVLFFILGIAMMVFVGYVEENAEHLL